MTRKHLHCNKQQPKGSKTYQIWVALRQRCNNPNNKDFHRYGGRGIIVDPVWNDYACFLRDMGECPKGYSIERIDFDKNYCKENCCWIPFADQGKNTSTIRKVYLNQKKMSLRSACKELNLHYGVVLSRVKRGWTVEEALERSPHTRKVAKDSRFRLIPLNGQSMPLRHACSQLGINYSTAKARLKRGWTVEQLLLSGK